MKKQSKNDLTHLVQTLPNYITFIVKELKEKFDTHGQKSLEEAGGVIGIIINLLGKPLLDRYFEKLKDKKLEADGSFTILKGANEQAIESLNYISENIRGDFSVDYLIKSTEKAVDDIAKNINANNLILTSYNPNYIKSHPYVLLTREQFENILRHLDQGDDCINDFIKHFNKNIFSTIKKTFGDAWEKHLDELKNTKFNQVEEALLEAMTRLGRIGFRNTENLKYETTYGYWMSTEEYNNIGKEIQGQSEDIDYESISADCQEVNQLINQFYAQNEEKNNHKILFIVSDFGKGKSVFLKHYASELAKKYLLTEEGLFPIYFNLNSVANYSLSHTNGILYDYLLSEFNLKYEDECFNDKEFIFLIDSLDESGKLEDREINEIIESIKRIQTLSSEIGRKVRIIIASRPFEGGLKNHLSRHNPIQFKNAHGKYVPHFISLYGFKKEQFNDWIIKSLENEDLIELKSNGFAKEVIDSIKNTNPLDIYNYFLKHETLTKSELERPIFAYMIYQLIRSDTDFTGYKKIGLYLSFLNILTKDAKHIDDPNVKINLYDELKFRNILHITAALWQKNRRIGTGTLIRADICRAIHGDELDIQDREAEKKCSDLEGYKFLAHSYFGDHGDRIYFNHQSFAEIALAEYYLKLFIRYALDEERSKENLIKIRSLLQMDDPTSQTAIFFKELLQLLRESSENINNQKRELLRPLLASMTLTQDGHNTLNSKDLSYRWFGKSSFDKDMNELPSIEDNKWPIKQKEVDAIISLAINIIESDEVVTPMPSALHKTLYKQDITIFKNNDALYSDSDRWLALLVGNILQNDINEHKLFASTIKWQSLINLINRRNLTHNESAPKWAKPLFQGIRISGPSDFLAFIENPIISHSNCSGIDFSYANFENVSIYQADFSSCRFEYATLDNVAFDLCDLRNTSFMFIETLRAKLNLAFFDQGVLFPNLLSELIYGEMGLSYFGGDKVVYNHYDSERVFESSPLQGIFQYILRKKMATPDNIKSWFELTENKFKINFHAWIDQIDESL